MRVVELETSTGRTFTAHLSEKKKSWRLVHDGRDTLALFESNGETGTIKTLFVGTQKQCLAEMKRLKLKALPSEEGLEAGK